MAEAEMEVVRAFIEAYRQGQTGAALDLLDEHAVLDVSRLNPPERGIAFGHEAVTQLVVRYVATFKQYDYELAKIRMTHFPTEREALEAVGLREQEDSPAH